jgi:hypothetical protein
MFSTARSYSVTRSAPGKISLGFSLHQDPISQLTVLLRSGATGVWEGIRDDIPGLKGQ